MAQIKCIDVSSWQGNIDWKKVKASGITCAVLRAGFGREASQIDNTFEQNYKNAKAAGLKVGAYWYSYADSVEDAKREAKACLEVIKGKSFELPVFYDMEENFQTAFGKETLTNMATAFMKEVIKGGFRVGIYANLNWFNNYLNHKSLSGTYFIWLAQYHTEAQLDCDMWQYSSTEKVSGIDGNVDMNIIYSDKLIKSEIKEPTQNFETANLQALLMIANRLGVITGTIPAIDNKQGDALSKAVLQMKKAFSMEANQKLDLVFIRKLYQAIIDALPIVGDVNGDGKVNIRDATALQKQIAGVDDV